MKHAQKVFCPCKVGLFALSLWRLIDDKHTKTPEWHETFNCLQIWLHWVVESGTLHGDLFFLSPRKITPHIIALPSDYSRKRVFLFAENTFSKWSPVRLCQTDNNKDVLLCTSVCAQVSLSVWSWNESGQWNKFRKGHRIQLGSADCVWRSWPWTATRATVVPTHPQPPKHAVSKINQKDQSTKLSLRHVISFAIRTAHPLGFTIQQTWTRLSKQCDVLTGLVRGFQRV